MLTYVSFRKDDQKLRVPTFIYRPLWAQALPDPLK